MATITIRQIRAAFALASEVYDGKLTGERAAARLRQESGLNINSARDFIAQYRYMRSGEVFKRSQSAAALEYFLGEILQTRGKEAADNALRAAWKHIAYYEELEKVNLKKLRAVAEAFQTSLGGRTSARTIEARFEAEVVRSRQDTSSARRARLKAANRRPSSIVVTVRVYYRNPDVVAEVLSRAAGKCEGCQAQAPFRRRSDRSPYLEVHHRTQLADNGEDTVANAIALCPNCHRKAHYG